jgi:hypothetical protein
LRGDDSQLRLTHRFDQEAFDALTQSTLGRIVLVTDREQWSTAEIISAYRSHAYIERLFRAMKNCSHIALRPQHHWTEQKVHDHVFTCVIAYLLAAGAAPTSPRPTGGSGRLQCRGSPHPTGPSAARHRGPDFRIIHAYRDYPD